MHSIVYFSPTGNALHLAELLAHHLEMDEKKILPLEFIVPNQLTTNEHLILLYPIHGFNAPRIVKHFVKSLPPKLYNDVSLIGVGCTTSWLNDAASSDLRKLFSAKGYPIILDTILAMPLTFIMAFPDGVSRKLIAESEMKIKDISTALIPGTKAIVKVEFKSQLLNFIGKAEQFAARLFVLYYCFRACNKSCTNILKSNLLRDYSALNFTPEQNAILVASVGIIALNLILNVIRMANLNLDLTV